MTPPVPGPKEGLNAAVAAQIRAEAAAANLTDKALAAKADVNYASLRRWLGKDSGNERHIDVAVLGSLADALGVPPAEIVQRAQARMQQIDVMWPEIQLDLTDDEGAVPSDLAAVRRSKREAAFEVPDRAARTKDGSPKNGKD